MATHGAVSQHAPWPLTRTALAAAGVVAAIQTGLLLIGNGHVLHGTLFDPDCYMHLQRALRLMTEGGWHDTVDPRIDAPGGGAIHWTALFDMLLAAGAAPLRLLGIDPHTALYAWGSVVSPVLLAGALAVYAWGVKTRVQGAFFLWLVVLIFTQPEFSGGFLTGRPDHQSLVLGLLVVQLGWLYAFFDGRAGPRWALAAGILAGVQICTSVEALLTILLVCGALTLAWLFYGVRTLKALAIYLGGCVAAIFLWLVWEHGRFLLEPAYDRVSVVHLVALGSGFICIATLAAAESYGILKNRAAQIGGVALAAAVSAAVTAGVYPDFFLGPWAHETPIEASWHGIISELQPLFPSDLPHAGMFLAQYTASLLSLPLLVAGVRRGTAAERSVMLTGLAGFVLFGALGLAQMRWTGEMQAVTLLPWALTTRRIMRSEFGLTFGKVHIPLRSFALSGAFLVQMLSMAFSYGGPEPFAPQAAAGCPWRNAIQALDPIVPPRSIVMTELWQGPEILWRTKLRVIAGPYELPAALADTYAFMDGSEQTAREIVRRRGIGFVLVCEQQSGKGFGRRLARGDAPSWLEAVPLPADAHRFRLYRVSR
jgi:hypothetical protein